jgi:CheY-like chemotaxis protein
MATVVLAEDDNQIRMVAERILRRAGHDVVVTADGAAGWQAVLQHRPDVVVSDIDMPVMSGVELSQRIRAHPETARLPVVLVSGSLVPGDTRPTEAHATAMLNKPFRPQELVSCVAKALDTGHSDGQAPTVCS